MTERPTRIAQYYRLVVVLAGLAAFIFLALSAEPEPANLMAGLLIVLAAALQTFFSLRLFSTRFPIVHITTLGCAMIYNPVMAGWAATAGMLAGSLGQINRKARPVQSSFSDTWLNALFSSAVLLLSLTLAFKFSGWIHEQSQPLTATLNLMSPIILFVLIHAVLTLADAFIRSAQSEPAFQHDLLWFTTLELIPLPIVVVGYLANSATGWAGAASFIVLPSLLAVVLFYFQRAQRGHERLEQDLVTLNQVSQAIQTTLNMEELLPNLQRLIGGHFDVDNFYVAIYDEEDENIWYPLAVKHGKRQWWSSRPKADRLTDRVIFERRPILIPSQARQELARIGLPVGEDAPRAWMGVPLRSSDQVIGCLAVFTYSEHKSFSTADLDLFSTISGQVGVAIANTLLHEKLSQRAAQLEAINKFAMDVSRSLDIERVFLNVCQAVTQVIATRRSAVFILDLGQGRITLAHSEGLSAAFAAENQSFAFADDARARCLHTGKPDLIQDTSQTNYEPKYEALLQREGVGALGSFPLLSPDGQIGYLAVYYDDRHFFNPQELELLGSFAAQAALAVSNARLHQRTDMALSRRVHQLSVLETISRELAAAIHSDLLFDLILDYAMEFTSSTWGMFSIYVPEQKQLEVMVQRGYQPEAGRLLTDQDIPVRSALQKKTINIPDTSLDTDYRDYTQGAARSHLSVPLLDQACVLGILSLESEEQHAFSDNDVAFVSQLANHAAIALQNARLFSDVSTTRDRLSAVLNSVQEGIVLFDRNWQVILTNRAVESITGLMPENIQGLGVDELPKMARRCLGIGDGEPVNDELYKSSGGRAVIDSPSGEKVIERSVVTVQGDSDRAVGWMLVLRDITHELRVVQERELITEMLVHDLRSPITAVLGALEVVESTLPAEQTGDSEIRLQGVRVARRGAQRVLALVENLLDISRMNSGKVELTRSRVLLHALAAGVVSEFYPQSLEYGVILQNRVPPDLPGLNIDQSKIGRVLTNLIDNALKYSPSGSQIVIFADVNPAGTACIRVSDSGPGIPPEYREKIFERFGQIPGSRGRRRGTGLGLTFCKLAVEAHGGRIWVETNSADGSDFVFTLPMDTAPD